MNILNLTTYSTHIKIVGLIAIVISIAAWSTDLSGIVYVCPYCRVQRSVIGLLGLLLITPAVTHWIGKYFGATVAANQHFMGWKKISAGTFEFKDNLLIDPFILSAFALTGIIGLTYLAVTATKTSAKVI